MRYLYNLLKRKLVKIKKEKVIVPCIEGEFLRGRYAFITGASSGIGLSIAEAFLRNGAHVLITGRDEEKLAKAKEELIKILNIDQSYIMFAVFDVKKFDRLESIFSQIISLCGWRIDIFVNNAGVNSGTLFPDTSETEYDNVLNTNLKGMYFASQVFVKYMISNDIHGNVLNITSSSSLRPGISPYILSKWGEKSLTLGMAKKYLSFGIIVNAIAPGPTFTSMLIDTTNKDLNLNYSPSKRYITTEEIGNIATILVSDMGRMIVGDTVYMTGGAGLLTYDDMSY